MQFGRLITAMVTPFTDDGNAIDYQRTTDLLEHLMKSGTDAVVVAGTTGESPTLSHDEKLSLFKFVKDQVGNQIKVIAGTSSNDTAASIRLSKEAEQCGVDGLLLVTPYYSRPSQEGLYQHFAAIASAVNLPCMLYNVPARTGINLEPETQVRLASLEGITASKEAGSAEQFIKLATTAPNQFKIYTGEDKMLLPALSVGGYGVVSVTSHVVGLEMKAIIERYHAGDVQEAARLNRKLIPVLDSMFRPGYPNPTLVKACLTALGIPCGPLRLPLVQPEAEVVQSVVNCILEARG